MILAWALLVTVLAVGVPMAAVWMGAFIGAPSAQSEVFADGE
ncbi:hypothetical protein BH11PSE2_BH11PSE2_15000 [soil metagenome]